VVYRKGELSKAIVDRQWPYQVALPAYRCMGHTYRTIHFFCEGLSLSPCTHLYSRGAQDVTIFCFAEREHAEQFQVRFGGDLMDPPTPARWPRPCMHPSDLSAEQRLRNGRCINCDD
jgi:hypothetical protein